MSGQITFIGFGEAAYHIAKGLSGEGFQNMHAYDVMADDAKTGPIIRARAGEAGVTLTAGAANAVAGADFILSMTSGKLALQVAGQILPLLSPGQVYLDCNSAAPKTKRDIAALPHPQGVLVCDATLMAAVPLNGHKVPMLLAGEGAEAFRDTMSPFGMRLEVLPAPPGGAAAVKLLRSVFIKGFPQLLLECMLAAEQYGVLDKILESIDGSIAGKNIRQLANQFFTPTVVHAARRGSEMGEVISMLQDMGLDASMSMAAKSRLKQLAALEIVEDIGIDADIPYQEILRRILDKQPSADIPT